jgi:hypothetical protein
MFRRRTSTNFRETGKKLWASRLSWASVGRVTSFDDITYPRRWTGAASPSSHELEQDRLDIAPARTRRYAPANISISPKTAPSPRGLQAQAPWRGGTMQRRAATFRRRPTKSICRESSLHDVKKSALARGVNMKTRTAHAGPVTDVIGDGYGSTRENGTAGTASVSPRNRYR